jgi:hypothetical protein
MVLLLLLVWWPRHSKHIWLDTGSIPQPHPAAAAAAPCRSFSYEEFIAAQTKFQRRQADHLAVFNEEVARAIDDVVALVQVRAGLCQDSGFRVCVCWCCLQGSPWQAVSCAMCHVLFALAQTSPRENPDVAVDEAEVVLFRSYYSNLMYKVCACDMMCGVLLSRAHLPLTCNTAPPSPPTSSPGHPGGHAAQLCGHEAAAGQQDGYGRLLHGAAFP